jgi:lipid-A-disaccharide synthase
MAARDQTASHVFLVAGEESGDRLGAPLMRALKARSGGAVRFSGVGGSQMAGEGLVSLFPISEIAVMGFAAIPAMVVNAFRRIQQTADAVVAAKPDVLVIIDSPDFTHRVARRVRKQAPTIPIIDYVSPTVWAWRPGRARAMRDYIDHVLALLPFEPAVHQRLGGPPCSFVGHPMSEHVSKLRPDATEAARREASPPILLVMPGSRKGELKHMLPLFEQTVALIAKRIHPIEIVVPTVPGLAPVLDAAVSQWPVPARVISDPAQKDAAFRSARAAVVKSGTGTLELALAGVPMVAAYRLSALEAFVLRRLITSSTVILANLVIGENVVPEFLQNDATPERLAEAAIPLLSDTPQRRRQVQAFARLDGIMEIETAVPSDRAAKIVLDFVQRGR